MASLKQPDINWESRNLAEEWRKFRQLAELMFIGPLHKTTEQEKCAYLLIWTGEKGREIYNSWNLRTEEQQKLDILYANFEKHTTPKKNILFARYLFHNRSQQQGEPFEAFVTDLRRLVKDCSYGDANEMVRDRIVCGVSSQEIREKLLQFGDQLDMSKAIDTVVTHEATKQQLATMQKEEAVEAIEKRTRSHSYEKRQQKQIRSEKPEHQGPKQQSNTYNCGNCGQRHAYKACPAFRQQCSYCKKPNHFAKMCRSRKSAKAVHHIDEDDQSDLDSSLTIDVIEDGEDQPDTAYANVALSSGDVLRFKIDTGAQANVIPYKVYKKLTTLPPLTASKTKLFGYAGQRIDVKGCIQLTCTYKNKQYQGTFHVADTIGHSQPVLGYRACLQLQIIKMILAVNKNYTLNRETILSEYKHLFDDNLGKLEGEVEIHVQKDAVPVVHPPRRIPHALRDRLKGELDTMENAGVISKVTQPTDWVNSLVVVEKPNGNLRICLDPKDLNQAVKRPHYSMPTLEDALAKLAGAKFFSKLDAKSGYWHLTLSQRSSFLTTFNSPFGRYRFNRMPFGLVSAQDEFQRKMDEAFEGVPGTIVLVDDVLVSGGTQEEHDANLKAFLDRATEKNVKLNPEKMTICSKEVEYFGHIVSAEGVKPDPKKIKAIENMPAPKDKKELETILGMVTYLSKFAPNLAEITKPLRDMLKNDVEFVWDSQQQEAWRKVKAAITSQPVLALYDPAKPLTLQVDASKHGLGAAIFQDKKPVAFASKSLNQTEQNYAQIEKELYAIVFGCERFHQYIYGQNRVHVQSDHKPLESIMKKPLASAPPRLQRMLLRLQKYSISVVHVPGKDIPVADTLSRKSLPAEASDKTEDLDAQIHCIINNLPVSDEKMKLLEKATQEDPKLATVRQYIKEGWPDTRRECSADAEDFWNFRDELSEVNGIIFKGEKIFVPLALRPEMLNKVHSSHLGIEKCLHRARKLLFWPKMASDIQDTVSQCSICNQRQKSNAKEPMNPHEIPVRPWQKVATDLFSWSNKEYLVTVDYYSRYFEIDELQSTTASAVIRKLTAHFARHGIPETVISDNGPQFASQEFQEFAKAWDFIHTTSSPRYAQSNGLAERTVQTVKGLLDKAKASGTPALKSILEYRNTPVDDFASPAQLLMGRQLRSILPVTNGQLLPKTIDPRAVVAKRRQQQESQKRFYDRSSRPLPPLGPGDPVFIQTKPGGDWQPGRVIAAEKAPRSFKVQTDEGRLYRRNRRFLRKQPKVTCPPPHPPMPEFEPQAAAGNSGADNKPETTDKPEAEPPYTTRYGRPVRQPRRLAYQHNFKQMM